jgi:hypothetical protein
VRPEGGTESAAGRIRIGGIAQSASAGAALFGSS